MKAILLTVGDELLIGQVLNTNAAWLGEQLSLCGAEVVRSTTLPDDVETVAEAIRRAMQEAALVVVTGGLGPTHDDVTREAVAAYAGVPLDLDETVLSAIRERFERRGRTMPDRNTVQALVPRDFEVLPNPVGTAPGLWYSGQEAGRALMLAVLPGVPFEMRYLTEHELIPRLRRNTGLRVIRHRTLLTYGIGESHLQERVGDVTGFLSDQTRLAYLPGPNGVRLRVTALGAQVDDVERRLEALVAHLESRISEYIYGLDADTIEGIISRVLIDGGLTLSVAESCTGGNLLNRITNVPGASRFLIGGVVAYCNGVKESMLNVSADTLARAGAVSEAVAREMAAGVRKRLGTDIGISTTGIAGPGGGTPDKPVGLVWIGYADAAGEDAVSLQFGGDRELNKELASSAALDLVRRSVGARRTG